MSDAGTRRKWPWLLLTAAVGLSSVILSEVAMVTWLTNVGFDATGDFFWRALLPCQLLLVGFTSAVLAPAYRRLPNITMPLYALTYLIAHVFELNMLGNPLPDILSYAAAILIACGVWFTLLWQFLLKSPA